MYVGEVCVDAMSDGTFFARPRYFGEDISSTARPDVFDQGGAAWLPIGCFLIRTGDRVILVDAGLGPDSVELPHDMWLIGGQLPVALNALEVSPENITDVVCTHLHSDHVGWLFDRKARPLFARATVWLGSGDWDHFVERPSDLPSHIGRGFRELSKGPALRLLAENTIITPGVEVVMTPGHTPGHLCVVIESGGESAILLGDAITCPVQLDEPSWHSFGDVDAAQADRYRSELWRRLSDGTTVGVGAHFPALRFGRVSQDSGSWQ